MGLIMKNLNRGSRKTNISCGLLIFHGSFKFGLSASEWDLDKIIFAIWKIFDHPPSSIADLEAQASRNYLLQFCSH